MKKNCRVVFLGIVQGVGFRFTAKTLAKKHNIKGWVSNVPDGSVEILAQAKGDDLGGFLNELKKQFRNNITDCSIEDVLLSENFSSFQIKFSNI